MRCLNSSTGTARALVAGTGTERFLPFLAMTTIGPYPLPVELRQLIISFATDLRCSVCDCVVLQGNGIMLQTVSYFLVDERFVCFSCSKWAPEKEVDVVTSR